MEGKRIKTVFRSDDVENLHSILDVITNADYETFSGIESMILDHVSSKKHDAAPKVLPIAALMSAKFHSFGMKEERDMWKDVIREHHTELGDALSALYGFDA